jgi:mono/diheme cytochrome c family protein
MLAHQKPHETPMHRTVAALLSLTFVGMPGAAWAANAATGKTLAERWCATCHVVSPVQKQATTQAPPFSTVAKKPGLTAAQLALFLLNPHPKMPDMNLTRNEAADLAAYIVSLK